LILVRAGLLVSGFCPERPPPGFEQGIPALQLAW
jgi:hypothetical protein